MADAILVDRLAPGDHVCWSFSTDVERRQITAAYVRSGLRRRQRVVCLPAAVTPEVVLAELAEAGVGTGPALATGQLQVAAAGDSYLAGGRFDGAATKAMFTQAVRQARLDGFTGLRALGDMAWGASGIPGAETLAEYERDINRLHADGFALGVCLYDRRLFAPSVLRDVYRAHPAAVTPRTPRTAPPMLRTIRTAAGLRLTGEADLSNRDSVVTVLNHLLEDSTAPMLTLDLAELTFADAGVCRTIVGLARDNPGRVRTVGAHTALRRLLELQGGDEIRGLLDAA